MSTIQDTDLLLLNRGGIDRKLSIGELKDFLNPKPELEIVIKQAQGVGQDHNRFRGTCRFVANVPDLRPYELEFSPRRYRESEDGPVTIPRPAYQRQNLIDYTNTSHPNSSEKEKFCVVITEGIYKDTKKQWESPQFAKQAYSAPFLPRLNISPQAGLYVDGDTITFNEDVWGWGEDADHNKLTPLTEEEMSNLHIRYYSALSGQKVAGGEFSGDIRDPANRTLDISSGKLTDAYGNNIEDVTCRIEYKTNVTYGTLMGESGWMLPIKPFSWEDK